MRKRWTRILSRNLQVTESIDDIFNWAADTSSNRQAGTEDRQGTAAIDFGPRLFCKSAENPDGARRRTGNAVHVWKGNSNRDRFTSDAWRHTPYQRGVSLAEREEIATIVKNNKATASK